MGVFEVSEANRKAKCLMAQDQTFYEALPNGTENLSIYSDNDVETYRDVLYYVGQVMGGSFVMNRAGQLELRKYENTPVLMVERRHRFTSSLLEVIIFSCVIQLLEKKNLIN